MVSATVFGSALSVSIVVAFASQSAGFAGFPFPSLESSPSSRASSVSSFSLKCFVSIPLEIGNAQHTSLAEHLYPYIKNNLFDSVWHGKGVSVYDVEVCKHFLKM